MMTFKEAFQPWDMGILPSASTVAGAPTIASLPGMPTMVQTPSYADMQAAMAGNGGNGFFSGSTFADKAGLALGGLQTLGNLWMGFQANKLANKQYNLTKKVTETNLANQIANYNTVLEDRARSRAFTEGQSAAQHDAYVDKNRLPAYGG